MNNAKTLGEELLMIRDLTGAEIEEKEINKITQHAEDAEKKKQAERDAAIDHAASTAGEDKEEGFEMREFKRKGGRKTKRRAKTSPTKTSPTKTRPTKTRPTKTRRPKTRRPKTRRPKKNKPSRRLL